jgi:hypothetical protein
MSGPVPLILAAALICLLFGWEAIRHIREEARSYDEWRAGLDAELDGTDEA